MKLLLFSDIHCSDQAAEKLVEKSHTADVVVGAGDFAIMRKGLDKVIPTLSRIEVPAVLVPGNGESVEELQSATAHWPQATVLHGSGTEIQDVVFFGLGGGVPVTPFGSWSYDFSEDQAAELLTDCPSRCVLVSHSPPHGLCDLTSHGQHMGSTAVRDAIDRCHPRLLVCGHIHESWTKVEQMGETTVINAGPQGILFELDGSE